MGTLGLANCPIKSAIQRLTAHATKSSPLQEQFQGLLLAESGLPLDLGRRQQSLQSRHLKAKVQRLQRVVDSTSQPNTFVKPQPA